MCCLNNNKNELLGHQSIFGRRRKDIVLSAIWCHRLGLSRPHQRGNHPSWTNIEHSHLAGQQPAWLSRTRLYFTLTQKKPQTLWKLPFL